MPGVIPKISVSMVMDIIGRLRLHVVGHQCIKGCIKYYTILLY